MDDVRSGSARRRLGLVIWSLVVVAVAAVAAVLAGTAGHLSPDVLLRTVGMAAFTAVGALIEVRRLGQIVGRLCLAIGGLLMTSAVFALIAAALDARPGRLPAAGAALAVFSTTIFALVVLLMGPLLASRFPDGRRTGRLAAILDVLLVLTAIIGSLVAFRPGPIRSDWLELVNNPLGLDGLASITGDSPIGFLAYGTTTVLALVGLIRRYVDGSSVVRAQIRWFAASICLSFVLLLMVLLSFVLGPEGEVLWSLWAISLVLPALAIGVAILRYRLYDIDRIISNTIGYGIVTVVLFAVFAVVNLALVSRVSLLVNNEGVAVAGSTLVVAALFNPLRSRVQRAIDHRFHRARYDADRTASEFAARLRDQLDLSTLAGDLASTSARAVEPTSSRVWLRMGPANR